MSRRTQAVVVAAAVLVFGTWVKAQQPGPPDVLPALLEEVKGLRAAMEQMASAGPRIQLFTSRLQLQEARVNNMIRRLDTVRDSLASAQKQLSEAQEQQRRAEARLAEPQNTPEMQEEARQMVFVLAQMKRETAAEQTAVARYTDEESQLTASIASEQARWAEINARLDELERALAKR